VKRCSFLDMMAVIWYDRKSQWTTRSQASIPTPPFLATIKERIQSAQVRGALAVNCELVLLFGGIGREILARQQQEGWGTKMIERLVKDLRSAFPHTKGFSRTHVRNMRAVQRLGPRKQSSCAPYPFAPELFLGHDVLLCKRSSSLNSGLYSNVRGRPSRDRRLARGSRAT
jgi:hypothetical protein